MLPMRSLMLPWLLPLRDLLCGLDPCVSPLPPPLHTVLGGILLVLPVVCLWCDPTRVYMCHRMHQLSILFSKLVIMPALRCLMPHMYGWILS